jgi:hypothetical protein
MCQLTVHNIWVVRNTFPLKYIALQTHYDPKCFAVEGGEFSTSLMTFFRTSLVLVINGQLQFVTSELHSAYFVINFVTCYLALGFEFFNTTEHI